MRQQGERECVVHWRPLVKRSIKHGTGAIQREGNREVVSEWWRCPERTCTELEIEVMCPDCGRALMLTNSSYLNDQGCIGATLTCTVDGASWHWLEGKSYLRPLSSIENRDGR